MYEEPDGHHSFVFQFDFYIDTRNWNDLVVDRRAHLEVLVKIPE